MAGSEQRSCVVVVFMGRQRNASCSSGGNETRAVHREPTGLDGTSIETRPGVSQNGGNGLVLTGHGQNGVMFIQPSTRSCSSSPPRGHVHPSARSIGVLFIQRQRPLLQRAPVHPTPHRELFMQSPLNNAHCSSRNSIGRLQLATVAKESLGFS